MSRAMQWMVGLTVLSFAVYAFFFSWQFAIILIGSLLFHEYGHVWAMQRCGIPTKGIYLIPFVGGVAVGSNEMPSRKADVFISLMGPIFGLALAIVTAIAYALTGWMLLAAATLFMVMVNLFNMVPIYPLDGGRVLKCVAYSVPRPVGIVLFGLSLLMAFEMFLLTWSFVLLLVIFFAWQGLFEYLERPQRQRLRARLENNLSLMGEGELPEIHIPSTEEVRAHLQKVLATLREPPPLSSMGIVGAAICWSGVVAIYGQLFLYIGSVPGVLESLAGLLGRS